jgi:hypothetical protein
VSRRAHDVAGEGSQAVVVSTGPKDFGVGLLIVEGGLAVLGGWVHYEFVSWYGDPTASALKNLGQPVSLFPLLLVALVGWGAAMLSPQRWAQVVAVAIPVVMVVGMLAVTPAALSERESAGASTSQCVDEEAASQEAFDSVEHVGYLEYVGSISGDGCDWDLLGDGTGYVDVLQHYRQALPDAGWQVVEDDTTHVRAERDGMAFRVVACGGRWVVWVGRAIEREGAWC